MYSVQCRQVNYVRKDDSCNITLVIYCKLNYLSMSLLITVHTSYIDGEIPPILIMADGLILQSAKNVHLLGYSIYCTVHNICLIDVLLLLLFQTHVHKLNCRCCTHKVLECKELMQQLQQSQQQQHHHTKQHQQHHHHQKYQQQLMWESLSCL